VRLLADENFDGRILAGLRRRRADLEIVRVQDSGKTGASDPELLAWAAAEDRILLTHDAATIPHFAYERVEAGLAMPGVFEVPLAMPVGQAIEELLLLIEPVNLKTGAARFSTYHSESPTIRGASLAR
jgi:Domain of unknown function (DUF5615)